jgi:uncharacterized protein
VDDPDASELRVLGCLIEKQRTTPDAYPLSLNALLTACNQATSRDPVTDYAMEDVRGALLRLGRRGWTRLASGPGSRAVKYRHLADEALGLPGDELAVLCVLMLRGPQTPGELRARTERLQPFDGAEAVQEALDALVQHGFAELLERRPGQKEARYAQRLGAPMGAAPAPAAAAAPAPAAAAAPAPAAAAAPAPAAMAPAPPAGPAAAEAPAAAPGPRAGEALAGRVAALEAEVAALRADLDALRSALGA